MQAHNKKPLSLRFSARRILIILLFFPLILLLIAGIFVYRRYQVTPQTLLTVATKDVSQLRQHANRVNILLLGAGGIGHEGGDLTDTVQVVSLDLVGSDDVIISFPRDIYLPSLKDRINSAYKFGEEKNPGSGFVVAKAAVEEISGLPMHYAVLIDFSGFKTVIDAVGGVDVLVQESFTDEHYPIAGKEQDLCDGDPDFACRYETISFIQGTERMDGDRALKYVRSRYSSGDTGNDYSRGKRQQAVLIALKNKLLTREVLTNRQTLTRLEQLSKEIIKTDLTVSEELLLGRIYTSGERSLKQLALTEDNPEKQQKGLLINPPLWQYNGAWVLIPKHEDFSHIQEYLQCELQKNSDCDTFFE